MQISTHIDVRFHNTMFLLCSVRIPTKYLLAKLYVMIYLLYALLAGFWYYRVMNSLLVLVQYRNSWVFLLESISVSVNFKSAFPDYAWRRKNLCFRVRSVWRGVHCTIGNLGLTLDNAWGWGLGHFQGL